MSVSKGWIGQNEGVDRAKGGMNRAKRKGVDRAERKGVGEWRKWDGRRGSGVEEERK